MNQSVRGISAAVIVWILFVPSRAYSFHWADREGYHSVDKITEVPLEHRRQLPMAMNRTSLPFAEEEDLDGGMYVWFILGQAGFDYPYTTAYTLPQSIYFKITDKPKAGDVAWWRDFMAIREGKSDVVMTAAGEKSLKKLEKKHGKVTWYRYAGTITKKKTYPKKGASRDELKAADASLARLDKAAIFPPLIKDDNEREQLKRAWEKSRRHLEEMRSDYPDDPRVLWRVGECYRLGHNLDVPGTWERAEAFLLRAEELSPETAEAYISLGAHYADTGIENGPLAESQFRQALRCARKEQLPRVWWGLAVALYYQGKLKEAVQSIDQLIAIHPEDANARKLRETFLKAGGNAQ